MRRRETFNNRRLTTYRTGPGDFGRSCSVFRRPGIQNLITSRSIDLESVVADSIPISTFKSSRFFLFFFRTHLVYTIWYPKVRFIHTTVAVHSIVLNYDCSIVDRETIALLAPRARTPPDRRRVDERTERPKIVRRQTRFREGRERYPTRGVFFFAPRVCAIRPIWIILLFIILHAVYTIYYVRRGRKKKKMIKKRRLLNRCGWRIHYANLISIAAPCARVFKSRLATKKKKKTVFFHPPFIFLLRGNDFQTVRLYMRVVFVCILREPLFY